MKKRILFINSVYGFGSTGKLVASLNNADEYDSLAVYGRKNNNTGDENVVKVTSFFENAISASRIILFNEYTNYCNSATDKLLKIIDEYKPDLIHIHNLHGYYINISRLLAKLKQYNKPIVWTLHDCWCFTGYCCYFDYANCDKYKTKCINCRHRFSYPFSFFKQNIEDNFINKINDILQLKDLLVFVTPSAWLKEKVKESYLKDINTVVINNGIKPVICSYKNKSDNILSIIAVANYWTKEKGLDELKKIIPLIDDDIKITIVGKLDNNKYLKERCTLIERTNNFNELINLYCSNDLLINPTLEDNFPTVNIESLACGTPIVSYDTGGSCEIYDEKTGISVKKYDYKEFANVINNLKKNYSFNRNDAVDRSKLFTEEKMINSYLELYAKLMEEIS